MAILNEYTVEVVVDGQAATEYDDDDVPEINSVNVVTRYVEAISGKEFAFKITIGPRIVWSGANCIVVRPELEGKQYTGIVMRQANHNNHIGYSAMLDGEWSGSGDDAKLYKYTFADLQTRDITKQDDPSKLKDKYGDLGSLKISLWREYEISRGDSGSNSFDFNELQAVPEKALKGRPLDVATTFKAHGGLRRPGTSHTKKLDPLPVATFVFKYRTRKALQSLLIVERSPTPVPLEERDPEQLTREELQELVRRQRYAAVKEEVARGVKRERSNTVPTTPMRPLKSCKVGGKTVYHIESSDDEKGAKDEQNADEASGAESDVEVVYLV